MPKERSINPAQAQRKAEKAKAIKKGKAEATSRRNEKLARRNPDRLQKQVDDLKAVELSGGKLTGHERTVLEELEHELKAVKRAREAVGGGDKAPPGAGGSRAGRDGELGRERGGGSGSGVLGKRRRTTDGGEDGVESDESEVPEEVKGIPMPRDTPPPIPKEVLDRWYQARRERHGYAGGGGREPGGGSGRGTNANNTPLGATSRFTPNSGEGSHAAGAGVMERTPAAEAKTVYEAAPVIRDLRREAVSAFVPAAVRVKMQKAKGLGGGLVEPEEADRLEREGYLGAGVGVGEGLTSARRDLRAFVGEDVDGEDGEE